MSSRMDALIERFNELATKSVESLETNYQLSQKLHNVQTNLIDNEHKIEDLSTRIENSSIFLQHLTSLNLRSEFFDSQLQNFENQKSVVISATQNHGPKEFREWKERNLNWRTTETTFNNLHLEFEYLSQQLKIANEYSFDQPRAEISDDSIINHTETSCNVDSSTSLFSNILEDSDMSNSTVDEAAFQETFHKPLSSGGRRLMKKESFLQMPFTEPVFETQDSSVTQLRGFNITETADPTAKRPPPLPAIEEELFEVVEESPKPPQFHRRHSSLPDTPTAQYDGLQETDLVIDKSMEAQNLRHFASHDTGLRKMSREFELSDFSFEHTDYELDQETAQESQSSPSTCTIKHSFLFNEGDDAQSSVHDDSSDENYGHQDAKKFIFEEQFLQKSKSLESIFSVYQDQQEQQQQPAFIPRQFKTSTNDLKTQTMKWITPNQPAVAQFAPAQVNSDSVKSHTPYFHAESGTSTAKALNSVQSQLPRPQTTSKLSWLPTSFHIPSEPLEIPIRPRTASVLSSVSKSSGWLSNLIPNSSLVTSETGKLIGQPASSQPPQELLACSKPSQRSRNLKTSRNVSFNGSHSTMYFSKNGNKIVRHGPGSVQNENAVLSSRVSHAALREALSSSFV